MNIVCILQCVTRDKYGMISCDRQEMPQSPSATEVNSVLVFLYTTFKSLVLGALRSLHTQNLAGRRARRLRRKRLAEKVVAHWKRFAREGIAAARARTHAVVAPRRRAFIRWRAAAAALRARRHARTADAGRCRFLAESRGITTWAAAVRASRERRLRQAAATAPPPLDQRGGVYAVRALHRWQSAVVARRSLRALERVARVHDARTRATVALDLWRGAAAVAVARRALETAALRAWAAGRLRCGLASLRHYAMRGRRLEELRSREASARRRLLALRGVGALDAAMLKAAGERDIAAEVEAGRARAALRRWRVGAEASRARATKLAEKVQ